MIDIKDLNGLESGDKIDIKMKNNNMYKSVSIGGFVHSKTITSPITNILIISRMGSTNYSYDILLDVNEIEEITIYDN